MCAVHDGRCSPWVMCSVVSGNRIHNTYSGLFCFINSNIIKSLIIVLILVSNLVLMF